MSVFPVRLGSALQWLGLSVIYYVLCAVHNKCLIELGERMNDR